MFSSLASFLFGSNTSATTNTTEANRNQPSEEELQQVKSNEEARIDAEEHTIEVTSTTPSVTGTSSIVASTTSLRSSKRGKNKRNKQTQKHKRQAINAGASASQSKAPTSIAKLLTPNDSVDEDIDEDDWYIVEKEDEEDSLPRTDSEEEVSVVGVKSKITAETAPPQRRRLLINSHSLYSGPRPQQQRNLLQRARNSGLRIGGPLSFSTLSPTLNNIGGIVAITPNHNAPVDGGVTQSLYVASTTGHQQSHNNEHNVSANDSYNNSLMDESWYVTPPPCFTSNGPIVMETSPFENLLIEHPSMSVYHSIRSAQEATESFVNLDLGINESQQIRESNMDNVVADRNQQQPAASSRSAGGIRIDPQTAAQLKQELLARANQKKRDRHERQKLCRTALKRANAVRDYQGKSNCQRRSDMQHCKVNSGANNNRKCCF